MCLYSQVILNPKYKANKKNGWVAPAVTDERTKYVPIGCNDCIECRKQKARQWQVRMLEDIKTNTNGIFVTLTFSNENYKKIYNELRDEGVEAEGYEMDNAIATRALRKFNERWRGYYKKALRHWMITELGHQGTENIHLHGIVWTPKIEELKADGKLHDITNEEIRKKWKYGFVWIGDYVNAQTVNYIIKYVTKKDQLHKTYKSIVLTSPGIGRNYTNRTDWKKNCFNGSNTIETYRTSTGHKITMPIYWRNKIYSDEEREKLWIQKLDKKERWICGERISIKNGEEEYYKILAHYRKRNRELGYGTGEKDWNREQYERQRRIIAQKRRIEATSKASHSTARY